MVTSIESLPNEVLGMIFAVLGDIPAQTAEGWAPVHYRNTWTANIKDVVMLSCVSKRFHTIGRDQRGKAAYVGKPTGEHQQIWRKSDKAPAPAVKALFEETTLATLTHLHVVFAGRDIAGLLGGRLHYLMSLLHLEIHSAVGYGHDEDGKRAYLCWYQIFFEAALSNKQVQSHQLVSFYLLSEEIDNFSLSLWKFVRHLGVCHLTLDNFILGPPAQPCPSLQRLSMFQGILPSNRFESWQSLCNLQEVWLTDVVLLHGAFWPTAPTSLHTIGICMMNNAVQAISSALLAGSLSDLRTFILDARIPCQQECCSTDDSMLKHMNGYSQAKADVAKIEAVLGERGGTAKLIRLTTVSVGMGSMTD